MVRFEACTGCGICCKRVGKIIQEAKQMMAEGNDHPALKEYEIFPYEINKDGSCSMLTKENRCSVYEDRPTMCNVAEMHRRYYQDIDEKTFIGIMVAECNKSIIAEGMGSEYLIKT